ncbi:SMI1/KNR4 family protein [Streptomyces sp. Je 1-4]|uniref:hypothetical protein n=1 Tax=Streptomyces TaxID=1883 RepID=UPI001ABFA9AF|nr:MULTISPECIES: hypothetical protein [unclassified Streptomyces]UYB38772.1 SMI1/KNR4 family protein [Streptomyces sp. Je 1-4]UZQ34751.1 SMI1/KNR4 family protein [Streptomyces sp. Je 1-4] [Streptomyces sp. Je 1-4 4N24]UZQ42169.1 SMI1/KNR4 family protein [Streptomyces sp. Je 1-4] [Streptomyces sp. Je 1-4 4N24_ara]
MIDSHGPLARIMERVPPPAEAVNGSGDWGDAERALGTPLPDDFKQVVEAYGRGDFWGALCLCTPFGDDEHERFDCGVAAFLEGWLSSRITSELLHHEPELDVIQDVSTSRASCSAVRRG